MTGVGGPSCDCGDGDGSSGSSSPLLHPPKLPSRHAFASQPERGAGGGVGGGRGGGGGGDPRSRRLLLVLCGDGSNSKMLLPAKTVSWEHLVRPVPPNIFHGRSFLLMATSSSKTHWNPPTKAGRKAR